jgi:hypothetical protein
MSAQYANRPTSRAFVGGQFLLSDWEIGKPFATAITKMHRRLLCINTMRRGFTKTNIGFFELTHLLEAASCRPYCLNDWQV